MVSWRGCRRRKMKKMMKEKMKAKLKLKEKKKVEKELWRRRRNSRRKEKVQLVGGEAEGEGRRGEEVEAVEGLVVVAMEGPVVVEEVDQRQRQLHLHLESQVPQIQMRKSGSCIITTIAASTTQGKFNGTTMSPLVQQLGPQKVRCRTPSATRFQPPKVPLARI